MKCLCGAAVTEIHTSGQGLGPKSLWQLQIKQHGSHSLHKCAILPFCNPILFWCVGYGCLMVDALSYEVQLKFSVGVFAAVIGA